MFSSPVAHRFGTERAWTEHLATTVGAIALLDAIRNTPLPPAVTETLDEVLAALTSECVVDDAGEPVPSPTHHVVHQFHLDGRYPDVVVHDRRDRVFAVVEAQRRHADDHHIAKLAARYVPASGARLGILAAEGWRDSSARHPAWQWCPAPVIVVVALDGLHTVDYQVAWVHRPPTVDADW